MKEIKLKDTKILLSRIKMTPTERDHRCGYMDLIDASLDVVPQGGFTPNDIRAINKLQDVLDKCKTQTLKLEDAEFETLKKYVGKSRWMIRDKELNEFLAVFE